MIIKKLTFTVSFLILVSSKSLYFSAVQEEREERSKTYANMSSSTTAFDAAMCKIETF